MKHDQDCGPEGMASMGARIKYLASDPQIAGIVLNIDSPGGTVDGTEAFANIVSSIQKPVISFVNGLAASAAIWIASQADEVFASTELDEVGSVGVLLSFADFQPAYEKMGVKFHTLVSNLSPDKVKMYEDLRAGKYDDYKKERLDPIAERFQNVMREKRPNVKDEHLTGKVYHAKDVMGVLVDRIGSLDDAVARAFELADQQNTNPKPKNQKSMKHLATLLATLGLAELVTDEGHASLSVEHLEVIEIALNADNAGNTEIQSQLDAANTQLTERDNTISTQNTRIQELESENAVLRGQPAEQPAAVITGADPIPGAESGTTVKEGMSLEDSIQAIKKEFGI
jgi:protease-4